MLRGKNVLVTGANRGIGRAVMEACARNGAGILALVRRETSEFLELAARIGSDHGVEVHPFYCDLRDPAAIKGMAQGIMKAKLPVDALINNAGVMHTSTMQMTAMDTVREVFEVNFFSAYLLTQYITKFMLRQKSGSIVNIASVAATDGYPGDTAYGASKAALIAMSRSLAAELGKSGIRVNCIAPGVTATDLIAELTPEVIERAAAKSDLGRTADAAEIAELAVFLASDASSYITAQTIRIDGGLRP